MTNSKVAIGFASLALLAFVCQDSIGASSDKNRAAKLAISVEDTSSIPDFDGDGTIGFGDFVIFAGVFGASQGDAEYDDTYDLNGDGEIGFSDFLIFAQNFGKEAPSPVVAIPDANLRAAIEDVLGKDSGAPITQAELAALDSLDANDADISVLVGLETAVNLTYLSLNHNDVTDISVLEGLTNLNASFLRSNHIADLAPWRRIWDWLRAVQLMSQTIH